MADQQTLPAWNGFWDRFNGGGRGGNFFSPREGYNGAFDLSGFGRILGGVLAGPLGAWGGGRLGNLGEGRIFNGGAAPTSTPPNGWDWLNGQAAGNFQDGGPVLPGGVTSVGQNDYGWFGGNYYDFLGAAGIGASGPRNVYVGNYGGAGDAFTNSFPNFGGDDVNMINPGYRMAMQGGGSPDGLIGNPNIAYNSPEDYMNALYGRNDGGATLNLFGGQGGGGFGLPPELMSMLGAGISNNNFDISQHMLPVDGGRGGGGRGGNVNTGQQQSLAAGNQFLTDAYTDLPQFSIDPNLQGMINGLIGQGAGGYDQFSGQLLNNPFVGGMMGMLGGGGGFGGGGYGGGGGGGYSPNVGYRDIPQNMVELLDSMRDANIGRLDLQTADIQDSMLADLYGRGVNRSSISQNEIGRLAYGQGQLLNDINAQIDAGRLGLIENDLDSQTAIAQSQIAAAAQRAAAASSAGASMFGSRAGLLGSMFGDYAGALASGFGSQQNGLANFANTLAGIGVDQMNTNAGLFSDFGNYATQANTSQDRLAGDRAAANASRYASRLGYNSDLLGYDLQNRGLNNDFLFNMLNFGEGQRQFNSDLDLRNRIFEQGIPSDSDKWLAFLGMLGGAAGNYLGGRQGGG